MGGNNKDNQEETEIEEEELVVEEIPQAHIIDTGDSVKVKQVLDDSLMAAVVDAGFQANYSWDNFKLFLMFLSCVFAMVAQFYPMPFPDSRPLLFFCCACYFILSSVLQFILMFVDKDTIMFTSSNQHCNQELRIRTSFPRFQEYYTFIVESRDPNLADKNRSTAKMYVGKYFTAKGEFDEEGFNSDVKRHLDQFLKQNFTEIEYNHKLD